MKLPNGDRDRLGDKLDRYCLNIDEMKEYDIVALLETVSAINKDTHQTIQLKCGQVGTVVMCFDDRAFLIDFADANGHTYAMETIPANQYGSFTNLKSRMLDNSNKQKNNN